MKIKIKDGYQTKIKSFKLELCCQCGGDMFFKHTNYSPESVGFLVECENCKKSSTVELLFNRYTIIGGDK
jgi:hypothetical protein